MVVRDIQNTSYDLETSVSCLYINVTLLWQTMETSRGKANLHLNSKRWLPKIKIIVKQEMALDYAWITIAVNI